MADKLIITKERTVNDNGRQKYAKRYSNGSFEFYGFASQAEAEAFLNEKTDIDTLKEKTPYKAANATTQAVTKSDSAGNAPLTIPTKAPDDIINVVRDYDWTYSKNKGKKWQDIPYIEISEFKLAANSYKSSLITSALLFPDVVATNSALIKDSLGGIINKNFADNPFAQFMSEVVDNAKQLTKDLKDKASNIIDETLKNIQSIDNSADAWKGITGSDDLKEKYAMLYIREKTGRKYRFPFFDKNYMNIANEFSDSYSNETEMQKLATGLTKLIDSASSAINMAAIASPGMFIQRPKFFNFATNEYTTNVEFYLFNTISPDSYVKNLELITKLVIQNTPHRHNRVVVDPICIYELLIPGRGFYPYTFISKMDVSHEGTRRVLYVNGRENIIPEAFKITLNLKSLTNEVNNFMIPQMGSAGISVDNKNYPKANPDPKDTTKIQSQPDVSSPQTGSSGPVSFVNRGGGAKTTVITQAGFLPNVKT